MVIKKTEEQIKLHNFEGSKLEKLKALYDQWYDCKKCELARWREASKLKDIVFFSGNPEAKLMFIGEGPGEEEERTSECFVGKAGDTLDMLLACVADDVGIQELGKWYDSIHHTKDNYKHFHTKVRQWRDAEFCFINIVGCRPPENRDPLPPEVSACWERIVNIIYIVDPWLIVTLGRKAIETLTHKKNEITKVRGQLFEIHIPGIFGDVRYPAMALFHPSYLMRKADWKYKSGDFERTKKDLLDAMNIVDFLKEKHLKISIPNRTRK